MKTIYFDHAATSYPKPKPVIDAILGFLQECGNPGRGGHMLAFEGARKIFDAREHLAQGLGIKSSEHLIFTPGCTYSINYVLKGLSETGYFEPGDCVLTGALEHNAVTRPLHQIKKKHSLEIAVLNTDSDTVMLEKKPKLVILTEASNVTGAVLDINKICAYCKQNNIPFLLDAAQTAGKISIDLNGKHDGVTFYCASSHKGLMGSPGAGLLYIKDGWQEMLEPAITGGTGSKSEDLSPPLTMPDRFEAGTQDGPAIVSMSAGLSYLQELGQDKILSHELSLRKAFLDWALDKSYVSIVDGGYGRFTSEMITSLPTVSFVFDHMSSANLSSLLSDEYKIAVRGGLHCARQAHLKIGSLAQGLVRASFGHTNTLSDVEHFCSVLETIANTKTSSRL